MSRALAWLYVLGGGLGLAAAAALTLEKIAKLRDPSYVPTCSLNPVVSCGSVMDSPQAEAFGFPNPLIGIAAFAVVVTTGVAALAGFQPPRWYRLTMNAGTGPKHALLALGYAGWGAGQLESEIQANGWLNVTSDAELLFDESLGNKWERAMARLGIDLPLLSGEAGHA